MRLYLVFTFNSCHALHIRLTNKRSLVLIPWGDTNPLRIQSGRTSGQKKKNLLYQTWWATRCGDPKVLNKHIYILCASSCLRHLGSFVFKVILNIKTLGESATITAKQGGFLWACNVTGKPCVVFAGLMNGVEITGPGKNRREGGHKVMAYLNNVRHVGSCHYHLLTSPRLHKRVFSPDMFCSALSTQGWSTPGKKMM